MKHAKVKEKKKKSKGFRIFLLVWVLILVGIGAYALSYVRATLVEMQASSANQFIADAVANISDEDISELFEFNDELEPSDHIANVRAYLNNADFTVKKVSGEDTYNLYVGEKKIMGIALNKLRSVSKLGIFNYNIYEFKGYIPAEDRELYHYEIKAPSSCIVSINGVQPEPAYIQVVENFSDAANYITLPSVNTYVASALTAVPEIVITKDGEPVSFEMSESIDLGDGYESFETLADADCDFDVLAFAEQWSRFMTKDLSGTLYGFYNISKNFIKDSAQYNRARSWARSIDITFTSHHTLKNPAFTEQRATNVVRYSADAVGVDVHLVKHMRLSTGRDQDDAMDSRIYLIRYQEKWYVVNMRGLSGDESANETPEGESSGV